MQRGGGGGRDEVVPFPMTFGITYGVELGHILLDFVTYFWIGSPRRHGKLERQKGCEDLSSNHQQITPTIHNLTPWTATADLFDPFDFSRHNYFGRAMC